MYNYLEKKLYPPTVNCNLFNYLLIQLPCPHGIYGCSVEIERCVINGKLVKDKVSGNRAGFISTCYQSH